jgi:hypothetical protein
MPDLTQGIAPCTSNILAYTRRYMLLLLIAKCVIAQFDSDFIWTTPEAQPEWDCKMSVSSKQKVGRDICCAVFRHLSWKGGTAHENNEKKLSVQKSRVGQDNSQNTTHSTTGRLCPGARWHIHRNIIRYSEQLNSNVLHVYPFQWPTSSIMRDASGKTYIYIYIYIYINVYFN